MDRCVSFDDLCLEAIIILQRYKDGTLRCAFFFFRNGRCSETFSMCGTEKKKYSFFRHTSAASCRVPSGLISLALPTHPSDSWRHHNRIAISRLEPDSAAAYSFRTSYDVIGPKRPAVSLSWAVGLRRHTGLVRPQFRRLWRAPIRQLSCRAAQVMMMRCEAWMAAGFWWCRAHHGTGRVWECHSPLSPRLSPRVSLSAREFLSSVLCPLSSFVPDVAVLDDIREPLWLMRDLFINSTYSESLQRNDCWRTWKCIAEATTQQTSRMEKPFAIFFL